MEDEVAGNDLNNDNTSSAETGPVKVIVKQDGIGRTGGIVLGNVAGLALGIAVMTLIIMLLRDQDRRDAEQRRQAETIEQMRKTETETRVMYGRQLEYKANQDSMNNRLMQLEVDHVRR